MFRQYNLDINKAYDHVNWKCLIYLLDRLGFWGKIEGFFFFFLGGRNALLKCWLMVPLPLTILEVEARGSIISLQFILVMEILSRKLTWVIEGSFSSAFQFRMDLEELQWFLTLCRCRILLHDATAEQLLYISFCFLRLCMAKNELEQEWDCSCGSSWWCSRVCEYFLL